MNRHGTLSPAMQQLDIFADSRDRVLLNTLADALVQGDRAAAHAAIATLRTEFPVDRHLGPAALLIDALDGEAVAGDSPVADAAAALAVHRHIDTLLHDAARTVLGREAAPLWLTIRWLALARRARALPFDPACTEAHAAALCLQGRLCPGAALQPQRGGVGFGACGVEGQRAGAARQG